MERKQDFPSKLTIQSANRQESMTSTDTGGSRGERSSAEWTCPYEPLSIDVPRQGFDLICETPDLSPVWWPTRSRRSHGRQRTPETEEASPLATTDDSPQRPRDHLWSMMASPMASPAAVMTPEASPVAWRSRRGAGTTPKFFHHHVVSAQSSDFAMFASPQEDEGPDDDQAVGGSMNDGGWGLLPSGATTSTAASSCGNFSPAFIPQIDADNSTKDDLVHHHYLASAAGVEAGIETLNIKNTFIQASPDEGKMMMGAAGRRPSSLPPRLESRVQ